MKREKVGRLLVFTQKEFKEFEIFSNFFFLLGSCINFAIIYSIVYIFTDKMYYEASVFKILYYNFEFFSVRHDDLAKLSNYYAYGYYISFLFYVIMFPLYLSSLLYYYFKLVFKYKNYGPIGASAALGTLVSVVIFIVIFIFLFLFNFNFSGEKYLGFSAIYLGEIFILQVAMFVPASAWLLAMMVILFFKTYRVGANVRQE